MGQIIFASSIIHMHSLNIWELNYYADVDKWLKVSENRVGSDAYTILLNTFFLARLIMGIILYNTLTVEHTKCLNFVHIVKRINIELTIRYKIWKVCLKLSLLVCFYGSFS